MTMICRTERGFTLMEILIALAVTMVALAGLMTLHSTNVRSNKATAQMTRAKEIADTTMEELKTHPVSEIVDMAGGIIPVAAFELPPIDDGRQRYTRLLWIDEVLADERVAMFRVEVLWTQNSAAEGSEDGYFDYTYAVELLRNR